MKNKEQTEKVFAYMANDYILSYAISLYNQAY